MKIGKRKIKSYSEKDRKSYCYKNYHSFKYLGNNFISIFWHSIFLLCILLNLKDDVVFGLGFSCIKIMDSQHKCHNHCPGQVFGGLTDRLKAFFQ
jgi:hypothetical protein